MILVVVFLLVPQEKILYYLPLNKYVSLDLSPFSTNDIIAGSFFVIASLTDFLDGYLARKYNWVSDFGKLWDPLADKLLVDATLICFAYKLLIPIWIVVILICRDFIVDAFRMQALKKNVVVPAHFLGKMKTFFQMIGLVLIFFFFNFTYVLAKNSNQIVDWYLIQNLFIILATIFSIASMFDYIFKINKNLRTLQKV